MAKESEEKEMIFGRGRHFQISEKKWREKYEKDSGRRRLNEMENGDVNEVWGRKTTAKKKKPIKERTMTNHEEKREKKRR